MLRDALVEVMRTRAPARRVLDRSRDQGKNQRRLTSRGALLRIEVQKKSRTNRSGLGDIIFTLSEGAKVQANYRIAPRACL